MKRPITASLAVFALVGLTACSEQTQEDAARTAERAGDDIEANAAVAGEMLEEGAKNAAGAVAEGAADIERHIEENDTDAPTEAPILGDNLNADQAAPND